MGDFLKRWSKDASPDVFSSVGCSSDAPPATKKAMTLAERCDIATACVPESQFREHLRRLFDDLLAASTPKSEPLTDERITDLWLADSDLNERGAYRNGFRAAERAHGITPKDPT